MRLLCALLFGLWPHAAWTQTASADGRAEAVSIRGVADMSDAARIELSRAAEPIWHEVKKAGATLSSIVDRVCGKQPAEVRRALLQRALRLNVLDDAETTFQSQDVVAVPFCLRVEERVAVKVEAGDTPSGILKREYGVFGRRTTRRFYRLNRTPRYRSVREFARNLRVGETVIVPFRSEPRTFVPVPSKSGGIDEVLAAEADPAVLEQLSMSVAPATAAARTEVAANSSRLRFVEPVELSGSDSAEACGGGPGDLARIVDADLLRARFDVEREKRRALLAAAGAAGLIPTHVGLIDSGLATIGDDFFAEKFFLADVAELIGRENEDDNGNQLIDDIYGINFYSLTNHGNVLPVPGTLREAHGTKMAALVLGGADLAAKLTGAFDPPVLRLKIVNFSDGQPLNPQGTASASLLPEALSYLKDAKTDLVNLSLATDRRIVVLLNQIRAAPDTLFLVAAGNTKSGGRDLRTIELYPARYGGDRGEPNVVTVGAHDLTGKRAAFSNFSGTHVDLLAPGCAVRTRNHKGETVDDNGTSPATAIVSFTAGLVHSLGITAASQIKIRLLIGTDFDPQLVDDAYASGRLNILKAIGVHHDIVEMRQGNVLAYGALSDPAAVVNACETDPAITATIHKVIPNIEENGGRRVEFWTEVAEELVKRSCTQSSAAKTLAFIDDDGREKTIAVTDIREIIFGRHVARP